MVYPIVIYGSPILRKVAKEIDKNYKNLQQLVADMFETMYESDGVGLAAPQIGLSLKLFVIDTSDLGENDPSLVDFKKAFINAKIIEYSGEKWAYNEGCLSLPKLREDVERPAKIRIQYYDENWNFYDEKYDGVKARVIQHEYDHTLGKLLIDYLSPLKKKIIRGKLNDMIKGKVDVDYKVKVIRS